MNAQSSFFTTDEEKEDIRYIISQSKNGIARQMDLSNEREQRFYQRQLEKCGITADKFPQTHKTIHNISNAQNAWGYSATAQSDSGTPVNVISQIVTTDGQNYYTDALSSIPGGTISTTITVGLYDADMNLIGPLGTTNNYNGGTEVSATTTGSFSTPMPEGGRDIMSLATIQYTTSAGMESLVNVFSSTVNFPASINNLSPIDVNHNGQIKICLNRQGSDCDYYNTSSVSNPVEVPIQGSIEYYNNIDVDANNQPVNASNVLQLVNAVTGGDPLVPPAGFDFFTDPNTVISGKNLSWNLGWVDFTSTYFGGGTQVYYIFSVTIQSNNVPVTAYITNAPSTLVPGQNSYNTVTLPPMVVVNGCLAADSLITMADKTQKPISEVQVGEQVLSNTDGTILIVTDTIIGTEEEPMIRVHSDYEHSLLLTSGHPVVTDNGIKLAKELQEGDMIETMHGVMPIIGITAEQYDGMVYNLNVGNLHNDKNPEDIGNATFFANDIVVGDGRMQYHFGKLYDQRKSVVLENLPPEWHSDYLSSLELK